MNIGDMRFPELLERKAAFRSPLPLDPMDENARNGDRALSAEDEYDLSMSNAVAELGASLSEQGRWTLEHVARPLADGGRIGEVAREAGISTPAATRLLADVREELSDRIAA
ncbi:MAG: hypothetical protein H0T97_02965 [Actinobacteria bacterium]|nr:hypothetical protein [Actinomycetota bacterium]